MKSFTTTIETYIHDMAVTGVEELVVEIGICVYPDEDEIDVLRWSCYATREPWDPDPDHYEQPLLDAIEKAVDDCVSELDPRELAAEEAAYIADQLYDCMKDERDEQ